MAEEKKKTGIGKWVLIILGILFSLYIIGSLLPEEKAPPKLSERSSEYQQMVYDRFKVVIDDPDIDSIKVDGSLLYINFIKPQPKNEYKLVARMNAAQFSRFKKEKLGVSSVTVIVTYRGAHVASADAQYGKVK